MKLLIVTQAVDLDDPVLGFFHSWILRLAQRCERVHVICLKEGRHELPPNVLLHSLGKENGPSRTKYVRLFYRYIRELRNDYDSVLVHMNEEYVLLGGTFWRLWHKRVVLWRNHVKGSLWTRTAARFANVVCYTSSSAFVARYKNAVCMPIGIDTDFFTPGPTPPAARSILFLGRLDPIKHVDVFIKALESLHDAGVSFSATIIGDPTQERSKYVHDVRNLASALVLEGVAAMRPGVTNAQARDFYRSHAIYCNLTPSGSFDKTIGEAMACGCVVVSSNTGVREVVPEKLRPGGSPEEVASSLKAAIELEEREKLPLVESERSFIEDRHSLTLLASQIASALENTYNTTISL